MADGESDCQVRPGRPPRHIRVQEGPVPQPRRLPAGKALFQMLGVFAEFERSIIQERIAAGIARARAKGTRSGKAFGRPKLSAEREAAVRAALAAGTGIRRTARLVGTGNATRGADRSGDAGG